MNEWMNDYIVIKPLYVYFLNVFKSPRGRIVIKKITVAYNLRACLCVRIC